MIETNELILLFVTPQQNEINQAIESRGGKSEIGAKREALFNHLKEIREAKAPSSEKKIALEGKIKSLTDSLKKKTEELATLKKDLPYKAGEEADEAVRQLEYQLAHSSFSLPDEKRIMAQISSLKNSKKKLQDFDQSRLNIEKDKQSLTKLREEMDEVIKQLNSFREKENKIKTELDVIKESQEKGTVVDVFQQRNNLRAGK